MDYLRWISRERKKARKKKRKELWEFYRIDDQKDQEIAEREINGAQAIRFLKATKLEFNFLENVIESERETVMKLIQERKQMNLKWISTERKKERKALGEFVWIDDQKDLEIVDVKSTTAKLSDSWKLANLKS